MTATSRELIVRDDDDVLIVNPLTGAVFGIRGENATTDLIAEGVDGLQDARSRLDEALGEARVELTRRMDKAGKWTYRTPNGYEIKSSSPVAGTVTYDAPALRADLLALVAGGRLDRAAVDAACGPPPSAVRAAALKLHAHVLDPASQVDVGLIGMVSELVDALGPEPPAVAVKSKLDALAKADEAAAAAIAKHRAAAVRRAPGERPAKVARTVVKA